MGGIWVADTEPDDRFPLYCRGNVGEVFPHVITALTGTLIGDAVRRSQTGLFVDLGVIRPSEATGETVSTGVFGGYLYMNASAMRLFGVRMPGMNPRMAEEQVTGSVGVLPPYRRQKGDRNLAATLAVSRTSIKLLRRPDIDALDDARRDAIEWTSTMPDVATAPDGELLAWIETYPPRLGASMRRLLEASMVGAAPRGMLERLVEPRRRASPGLVNRVVTGTGEVDSAEPARRLWALGRVVASDPDLTAAFDAGLEDIGARVAGTALATGIQEFLRDHGHRGNDEYELATPAWAMDPTPIYATIDRLRLVSDDRDPVTTGDARRVDADVALDEAVAAVPWPLRRIVRRAGTVARLGEIARERAKDILVFENLAARRVLHELIRRGAERGGPDDPRLGFCITFDELPGYLADPTAFRAVMEERAAQERYLNDRVPPFWFAREIPDPSTWEVRGASTDIPAPGSELTGIAVSSGRASGRARVIAHPSDPRGLEPGEVLVCAITDPSWTPLFLTASAVVCDTGAMQSHASIVARELGIPAVMSVPGITSVADGTLLHVDGDRGLVTVG